MQNGGDIKAVFDRLARAQKAIEAQAKFATANTRVGRLDTPTHDISHIVPLLLPLTLYTS